MIKTQIFKKMFVTESSWLFKLWPSFSFKSLSPEKTENIEGWTIAAKHDVSF